MKCFVIPSKPKIEQTVKKLFPWKHLAHKFAAVSRCMTWSHLSWKFKLLFPNDIFPSNWKRYLSWEITTVFWTSFRIKVCRKLYFIVKIHVQVFTRKYTTRKYNNWCETTSWTVAGRIFSIFLLVKKLMMSCHAFSQLIGQTHIIKRHEFYFQVTKTQYFTNQHNEWVKYCFYTITTMLYYISQTSLTSLHYSIFC